MPKNKRVKRVRKLGWICGWGNPSSRRLRAYSTDFNLRVGNYWRKVAMEEGREKSPYSSTQ